ncbi:beta-xylosidase [Streptomyces sp. INR7]|uniref:beta-xylosidase n=1 Tax=Streptomyces sp. INR7 TaxID=2607753 RepID=UPI0016286EA7|nr:beta-xylosidase [Streptomyces sp. INR7]QNE27405.1 beta-xylosidase [Streptomyces sp. INR7]
MAALVATTGGVLGAPAAAEWETPPGQVEFPTQCLAPQEAGLPPADGPTTARITVDDPAPRVGDTVTVTYQVIRTPARNPVGGAGGELPADVLTPTGRILLAGAQSGEVTVVGAQRNDPVPAGEPLPAVTMTGTFTVTAPGGITLAPGPYTLHTGHLVDLDTTCTAAGPVSARITATELPTANLRSVFLATAHGRPGAEVRVTAAGFPPGAAVTVAGRAGAAETADRVSATADDLGTAVVQLPVTDRTTTAVVAYEGAAWSARQGSGPAAYAVVAAAPPASATQKVTATVEPGALGMTQAGRDITLGTVPYGDGGAAPGRIGTVTVTDARGGPAGWSLTGKVTDFTGPGGIRIPGASLSWTPSCTAAPGSLSPCTPGSAGIVGPEGALLASTPDAPLVGGTFTIDATVTLHVPPYTPPGAYTAVLTLTLS